MNEVTDWAWTDERVETAISLRAAGVAPSVIAAEIGASDSHAVTNKIRRVQDARRKAFAPLQPAEPEPPEPTLRWSVGVSRRLLVAALAEAIPVISYEAAEVLGALLVHPSVVMEFEQLRASLGLHRPVRQGALYERISKIRSILGRNVIGGYRAPVNRFRRNDRGEVIGDSRYYLTDEGVSLCCKALDGIAARLPLRTTAKAAG